jgi:hypothetical protein
VYRHAIFRRTTEYAAFPVKGASQLDSFHFNLLVAEAGPVNYRVGLFIRVPE